MTNFKELVREDGTISFDSLQEAVASEREVISMEGGIFVIPNSLSKPTMTGAIKRAVQIGALNGIKFDPETDLTIQVWPYITGEYHCDNLGCHSVMTEEGHISATGCSSIPLKLVENLKEGEVLHLCIPATRYMDDESVDTDVDGFIERGTKVVLDLQLVADQTTKRYRSFGKFEEVVARLKRDSRYR